MPILRLPVFDTTSPGVGGLTETASVRVTGISPLRGSLRAAPMRTYGWTGVSLCTDEVIAKQLVLLFCGRMGTARRLIWPSFMRENRTGGSWRILQCRYALSALRQGTYLSAGYEIFKVPGRGRKQPPHY